MCVCVCNYKIMPFWCRPPSVLTPPLLYPFARHASWLNQLHVSHLELTYAKQGSVSHGRVAVRSMDGGRGGQELS